MNVQVVKIISGNKKKLRNHNIAVHENRLFNCTKCKLRFTLRHQLQNHFTPIYEGKNKIYIELEIEGKQLFECGNCSSKFTPKSLQKFS